MCSDKGVRGSLLPAQGRMAADRESAGEDALGNEVTHERTRWFSIHGLVIEFLPSAASGCTIGRTEPAKDTACRFL